MSNNQNVKELNADNFDELTSQGVALVDFWAPWCNPCRNMSPIVDELAGDFAGQALVGKVNIDESDTLAARFGVMTIPSFFVLKDGEVVKHLVGFQLKDALKQALQQVLTN